MIDHSVTSRLTDIRTLRMERAERTVAAARCAVSAARSDLSNAKEVAIDIERMRPKRESDVFESYCSSSSKSGSLEKYRRDMAAIVEEVSRASDEISDVTETLKEAEKRVTTACRELNESVKKLQKLEILNKHIDAHKLEVELINEDKEMDDWLSTATIRRQ